MSKGLHGHKEWEKIAIGQYDHVAINMGHDGQEAK